MPTTSNNVPVDLKRDFGVEATPIPDANEVWLDGKVAQEVPKTMELPDHFLTEHADWPGYYSTQVAVVIKNTSSVAKWVDVMYADEQDNGGKIWIERAVTQDGGVNSNNLITANSSLAPRVSI